MVKIIFLGSAGSTEVLSKGELSAGGIILQFEGIQFHLDPGPGALKSTHQMGVNPKQTTVFLASSSDITKCHDLSLMIDLMTYSGTQRRGLLISSPSVVKGDRFGDVSLKIAQRDHLDKLVVLDSNNKVGISLCEVHPIKLDADDPQAIGFKLFFPNFVLSYVPKTNYTEELASSLEGSDMIILDIFSYTKDPKIKALDLIGVQNILEHVKPKLCILNGFGMDLLKADPIMVCRNLATSTMVQCVAAKKGLVLNSNAIKTINPIKGF